MRRAFQLTYGSKFERVDDCHLIVEPVEPISAVDQSALALVISESRDTQWRSDDLRR